jgi:DNA (cytosine-5)-methyltransferase 3A
MNVLSLFDGMSCGRIALDRAGIPVTNYYASEIDKYAIEIAKKNWLGTVHLGDVRDVMWPETFEGQRIDLLLGGSPCQGFSFAGKQLNFDDPRSKLFFEYVRILKEARPRWFLLENVRMKQESQDIISEMLGVKPVAINSSLVSAQNRYRLYWTNIPFDMPADKGLVMRDILEDAPQNFTVMSDRFAERQKDIGCLVSEDKPKARCLSATEYVKNGRQGDYIRCDRETGKPNLMQTQLPLKLEQTQQDERENELAMLVHEDRSEKEKASGLILAGHADDIKGHGYNRRVYHPDGKAPSLCAASGGNLEPKTALSDTAWRKLTPIECERLQTVPDNYTQGVSNTQRYRMLGNGWTVDVIAHILRGIGGD